MTIDKPKNEHLIALRSLWKEAFGDTDEFIDAFIESAFSPDRCRCVFNGDSAVAALYWFDCLYREQRVAYLYAIATAKEYRGQGICSKLMKDTHSHLKALGYAGAILVPGSERLFEFYEKLGYKTCSSIGEVVCDASESGTDVRHIDAREYAALRRKLLPLGGVVQENENLDFLKMQASFFAGDDFLLAARGKGDTLYGVELLGDKKKAPAILQALGYKNGAFRVPAADKPFAMYIPLTDSDIAPSYFGLAFD